MIQLYAKVWGPPIHVRIVYLQDKYLGDRLFGQWSILFFKLNQTFYLDCTNFSTNVFFLLRSNAGSYTTFSHHVFSVSSGLWKFLRLSLFFNKASIFLKGIFEMFVECPLFGVCLLFCHDQIEVMSLREEYQKGKIPFSLHHIKGYVISSWFILHDATLAKWFKKLLFFFFFESKSPSPVNTQRKER